LMYANIILMGGNMLFPGFKDRLELELRQLLPSAYKINIHMSKDPVLSAYRGGTKFAQHSNYDKYVVTKQQFEEHGNPEDRHLVCERRFNAL